MGIDPLLVNAAQADRPGRGWWRNIIDLYGAADILVAEVQFQRLYPGRAGHGPIRRASTARTSRSSAASPSPGLRGRALCR